MNLALNCSYSWKVISDKVESSFGTMLAFDDEVKIMMAYVVASTEDSRSNNTLNSL